ncbi:hypothetical protein I4U23_024438 [Adineta vaga]|nr:hypothetical protein I4U23_024438 [Adineta vaga]
MYSNSRHLSAEKPLVRLRKQKLKAGHKKIIFRKSKASTLTHCYQAFLTDLKKTGTQFLSYTITELEPICQQIAIQHMSASSSSSSSSPSIIACPWICFFCEDLIYEPLTLYCGHTYCEQCIKDEGKRSIDCPRCPKNIQGQITSSIQYALDNRFNRNHFLKEIIDHSKTLKFKHENIILCHQARNEYFNENYLQAIEIYSQIITKYDNEHLAYYGRAKTYKTMKQFDKAVTDIEQVIRLKPFWRKGYYCRSQILFEMQRFTSALLSSLQGLTLDPEDQTGKQIMAQHLHAVLHNNDDNENILSTETSVETCSSSSNDKAKEPVASDLCDKKLLACRSTTSTSCLCTLFDHEQISAKDYECSICINLLWIPVTTPCGHVFCRECLIRSIDNTNVQCPMCKNSLEQFFPMLIQSYVNTTEIISQLIESYFPEEYQERRQLYEQENSQGVLIPMLLPNSTESLIFEIPIFMCVLALPFCSCPLHVFEPRYRLMIRRTMSTQSRTFGMCTYDEQTETFADYGTLLYIRGLVYTQDGRSIVDTIGRQRFRVIDRGMRDQYYTARVQLIQDHPIEQEEFDDLFQLNRNTYQNVRHWFDQLDIGRRTLISRQLEEYPICDDLNHELSKPFYRNFLHFNSIFMSFLADGPSWAWQMLNVLPIEAHLQYNAFISLSFRTRLQMMNDTINFLLNQQQHTAISLDNES